MHKKIITPIKNEWKSPIKSASTSVSANRYIRFQPVLKHRNVKESNHPNQSQ